MPCAQCIVADVRCCSQKNKARVWSPWMVLKTPGNVPPSSPSEATAQRKRSNTTSAGENDDEPESKRQKTAKDGGGCEIAMASSVCNVL